MIKFVGHKCSFNSIGNVEQPLSENSFLNFPSYTFEIPYSDNLPKPKVTQSPVTITFSPSMDNKVSLPPEVAEIEIVDVALAKESELFSLERGGSCESDPDLGHTEGLHTIRETLTVQFRDVQSQGKNVKTYQGYIERLECELFKKRDIEDRTTEKKLKLLKQFTESVVQSRKHLMTFLEQGEAKLFLLDRINGEIAEKKRKPFIDSDSLTPEQKVVLDRVKKMLKDLILKKSIENREEEREKKNSD